VKSILKSIMTADFEGSAPAGRVLSSGSATNQAGIFPNGHLGHLTAPQEEALERFKAILAEKGLWRAGPPPSHDDQTLLRYLRARRWIADDALVQFKDTEEWRAANNIDILYRTIELDAYEQSRRLVCCHLLYHYPCYILDADLYLIMTVSAMDRPP
jgi:hypothetical protein